MTLRNKRGLLATQSFIGLTSTAQQKLEVGELKKIKNCFFKI